MPFKTGVLGRLTTRVVGIQHMQAAGDRRWLSPSAGTRLGGHVSRAGHHDAARAPMVCLWRCGISIAVPSLCKLVLLRAAGGLCRAGLPGTVGWVAGVTALAAGELKQQPPPFSTASVAHALLHEEQPLPPLTFSSPLAPNTAKIKRSEPIREPLTRGREIWQTN